MCVYIYIYIYTYIYIYIHTYIHVSVHATLCACVCVCVRVAGPGLQGLFLCGNMGTACIFLSVCECRYVYAYMY